MENIEDSILLCYDTISLILWICKNKETYELYQRHRLGVILLKDEEVVPGASSYSVYIRGIEIEIDTHWVRLH